MEKIHSPGIRNLSLPLSSYQNYLYLRSPSCLKHWVTLRRKKAKTETKRSDVEKGKEGSLEERHKNHPKWSHLMYMRRELIKKVAFYYKIYKIG